MRTRLRIFAVALFAAMLVAAAGCGGGGAASGADSGPAVRPAAPDFTTDAIQAADGKLSAARFTRSERAGAVSVLYFSFVG